MCARPLSPRHAQPDWMGGGLVSRQIMHAPPSAAIHLFKRELSIQMGDAVWVEESSNDPLAAELGGFNPNPATSTSSVSYLVLRVSKLTRPRSQPTVKGINTHRERAGRILEKKTPVGKWAL
jgi:hypothetical protein